ncbi:hypothetical protein HDA40_002119 [Hamadaea flava]|uniref:Uncharacterized protein n=1 Tax=Hamadaea flava TaxID=1742688 RepID=A0ABV8LJM0_9ACTN|nr:hypothetical protein [Hamadaea flava]MCP2323612.1 hypothetical protein [Hamadaea flava]
MTISEPITSGDPMAGVFSAESTVAICHRVGKHFLPSGLLRHLDRQRGDPPSSRLDGELRQRWLDSALDKFDGRYDYNTYLALPVFDLPNPAVRCVDPRPAAANRDLLVCWLLTDILDFELRLDNDADDRRLPLLRPNPELRTKRAHLALRAVAAPAQRLLGVCLDPPGDPHTAAGLLTQAVTDRSTTAQRHWWPLTMMPVYRAHDEWLFIRVLQSFEVTFAQLAVLLAHAVDEINTGRNDQAIAAIGEATALLGETRPLFSLIATMQRQAFGEFPRLHRRRQRHPISRLQTRRSPRRRPAAVCPPHVGCLRRHAPDTASGYPQRAANPATRHRRHRRRPTRAAAMACPRGLR